MDRPFICFVDRFIYKPWGIRLDAFLYTHFTIGENMIDINMAELSSIIKPYFERAIKDEHLVKQTEFKKRKYPQDNPIITLQ
ncbi:hypothetical protein TUMSATVNIG1_59030 (plasmid) [Vibrio nigripulchritudo]|nr:hypothetical protein VNTUMSATTG_58550 [Vibrio nigripulchritudo]BDU35294.1 hypothetical protein TUMSATVNIG1_59030 [Vibrio nigripulchritudo]